MLFRMKYIDRWALMRNSMRETLTEHAQETAVLAHALATIGNLRCGKNYAADRAAVLVKLLEQLKDAEGTGTAAFLEALDRGGEKGGGRPA